MTGGELTGSRKQRDLPSVPALAELGDTTRPSRAEADLGRLAPYLHARRDGPSQGIRLRGGQPPPQRTDRIGTVPSAELLRDAWSYEAPCLGRELVARLLSIAGPEGLQVGGHRVGRGIAVGLATAGERRAGAEQQERD